MSRPALLWRGGVGRRIGRTAATAAPGDNPVNRPALFFQPPGEKDAGQPGDGSSMQRGQLRKRGVHFNGYCDDDGFSFGSLIYFHASIVQDGLLICQLSTKYNIGHIRVLTTTST